MHDLPLIALNHHLCHQLLQVLVDCRVKGLYNALIEVGIVSPHGLNDLFDFEFWEEGLREGSLHELEDLLVVLDPADDYSGAGGFDGSWIALGLDWYSFLLGVVVGLDHNVEHFGDCGYVGLPEDFLAEAGAEHP